VEAQLCSDGLTTEQTLFLKFASLKEKFEVTDGISRGEQQALQVSFIWQHGSKSGSVGISQSLVRMEDVVSVISNEVVSAFTQVCQVFENTLRSIINRISIKAGEFVYLSSSTKRSSTVWINAFNSSALQTNDCWFGCTSPKNLCESDMKTGSHN